MQTTNKGFIIAIASLLVVAFFLPWLKFYIELSAWSMVFGETAKYVNSSLKYVALLIPIAAGVIIFNAGFNNETYPIPASVLFRIPLFTILFIFIFVIIKINELGARLTVSDINTLTRFLGVGFWLTFIGAAILPFLIKKSAPAKFSFSNSSRIGIFILIAGIALLVISSQNHLFEKTSSYRVDPGAFGLPDAYNLMGPIYDNQTFVDKEKKNLVIYLGIALVIAGGLLFSYGRQRNRGSATEEKVIQPLEMKLQDPGPLPDKNMEVVQPETVTHYRTRAKILPGKNSLIIKYKFAILGLFLMVIASVIVYTVFFKPNPIREAKALANNYCKCSDDLNKIKSLSYKSFNDSFQTRKFKSRLEARTALNEKNQVILASYNNCVQEANLQFSKRSADFRSGNKDYLNFQQTYNSIIAACNTRETNEILVLQHDLDQKIKSITEPEPDIDRIKSELIGKTIPGWQFKYLNDFRSAEILNKVTGAERLEFQVKFDLFDNSYKSQHECEVMVVYLQDENGWKFSQVVLNYITFVNTFYPDKFVQISPLQGCTWTADNNFNLAWKTTNDPYAGEMITGPARPPVTMPPSSTYFIKSLEGKEISVKFTYRPN